MNKDIKNTNLNIDIEAAMESLYGNPETEFEKKRGDRELSKIASYTDSIRRMAMKDNN